MTDHARSDTPDDPGVEPSVESELELDEHDRIPTSTLADSLAQLMQIPADLEARTSVSVAGSIRERSVLGTATDLLAVGWQTLGILAPAPPAPPAPPVSRFSQSPPPPAPDPTVPLDRKEHAP